MKKSVGYILVALGVVSIAISYSYIRTLIGITLPTQITELYLIIAGIILIVLGGLISSRRSKVQAGTEVPIYHGNKIIGYRRH